MPIATKTTMPQSMSSFIKPHFIRLLFTCELIMTLKTGFLTMKIAL